MKHKMKIGRYVDDSSLTLEERYEQLEAHHLAETAELRSVVQELEAEVEFFLGGEEYYAEYEEVHDFSDLT